MAKQYGKWEILASLGEGGQGHTFTVVDREGGDSRHYVLKRLKNRDRIGRLKNEIAAALALAHENIICLVDSDLEHDPPYIVTELCLGGPLSGIDFRAWEAVEILRLFRDICNAVGYAHARQIVHRDLKPDNIFLKEDRRTPVVGDFGICFLTDAGERFTLTDEAVGARKFTAPELEDGRVDEVSYQADVYSLGKILYWLFAGRVFDREKHRESRWDLTGDTVDLPAWKLAERAFVKELLDQSIVQERGGRFADARHFCANVDRAIRRILMHEHVLDLNEVLVCAFCGIGRYVPVADSAGGRAANDGLSTYGISLLSGTKWLVLECNHCGNTQTFRTDNLGKDPWKGRTTAN